MGHNLRILITNDDGIYAKGLWTLVGELKKIAKITVVAPEQARSAVGTAVTLRQPLRLKAARPLIKGVETYSIEGTPSDAVILALSVLSQEGFNLLASGINEGANVGNDVFISGTVAAALQGYFHDLPSLALSVAVNSDAHFEAAAKLAKLLINHLTTGQLFQDILLNINLPKLPLSKIRGIQFTKLAQRSYADVVSPDSHQNYYRIARGASSRNKEKGTDVYAIDQGFVSITPMRADLTNHSALPLLHRLCSQLENNLLATAG